MNSTVILMEWEAKRLRAMQAVARMIQDLDKYKNKPDASKPYIEKTEAIITAIKNGLDYAPVYLAAVQAESEQDYLRGYAAGRKEAEKEQVPSPYNREAYRAHHQLNVINAYPDLF